MALQLLRPLRPQPQIPRIPRRKPAANSRAFGGKGMDGPLHILHLRRAIRRARGHRKADDRPLRRRARGGAKNENLLQHVAIRPTVGRQTRHLGGRRAGAGVGRRNRPAQKGRRRNNNHHRRAVRARQPLQRARTPASALLLQVRLQGLRILGGRLVHAQPAQMGNPPRYSAVRHPRQALPRPLSQRRRLHLLPRQTDRAKGAVCERQNGEPPRRGRRLRILCPAGKARQTKGRQGRTRRARTHKKDGVHSECGRQKRPDAPAEPRRIHKAAARNSATDRTFKVRELINQEIKRASEFIGGFYII